MVTRPERRVNGWSVTLRSAWGPVVAALFALAITACANGASVVASTDAPSPVVPVSPVASPRSADPSGGCTPTEPAVAEGPSAEVTVLAEGGNGSPRVEGVVYPRPDYAGRLWSQWGQGLVLSDGRFLSAIGDHQGVDGNSFLFVHDPRSGRLTRFADVLSQVDHDAGAFGYGKIHAQMVEVACDQVVFATYWGTRDGLSYGGSYTGDWLFSIDPATLALQPLGVPVPEHGIPSLAAHDGLVYGEAVDPRGRAGEEPGDVGEFFVYDPERREVVYRSADPRHIGFRSIAVDAAGRAFVAMPDGGLLRYDPGGQLVVHGESLPAGWLRAAAEPAADGTVFAVTTQPERYVALRADGSIDDLGPAEGYTASIALSPSGEELLVVPGAHGGGPGGRLLAVDVSSGEERLVVDLGPLVQQGLGLALAGSYNLAVDENTGRIYIGFNAGTTADNPWGEVVLVTVDP